MNFHGNIIIIVFESNYKLINYFLFNYISLSTNYFINGPSIQAVIYWSIERSLTGQVGHSLDFFVFFSKKDHKK